MNCQLIENSYIAVSGGAITCDRDGSDIISACFSDEVNRVLFCEDAIGEDFYTLRTGVAGAIMQKLVNYHIKAAAVVTDMDAMPDRFREMAMESNVRDEFRFFESEDAALLWLLGQYRKK